MSFNLYGQLSLIVLKTLESKNPGFRDSTYFPPNAPNGVRLDATMKDSGLAMCDASSLVVCFMLGSVTGVRSGVGK
jgi:hypothetical protein